LMGHQIFGDLSCIFWAHVTSGIPTRDSSLLAA
jgi:hypothetical protein